MCGRVSLGDRRRAWALLSTAALWNLFAEPAPGCVFLGATFTFTFNLLVALTAVLTAVYGRASTGVATGVRYGGRDDHGGCRST